MVGRGWVLVGWLCRCCRVPWFSGGFSGIDAPGGFGLEGVGAALDVENGGITFVTLGRVFAGLTGMFGVSAQAMGPTVEQVDLVVGSDSARSSGQWGWCGAGLLGLDSIGVVITYLFGCGFFKAYFVGSLEVSFECRVGLLGMVAAFPFVDVWGHDTGGGDGVKQQDHDGVVGDWLRCVTGEILAFFGPCPQCSNVIVRIPGGA